MRDVLTDSFRALVQRIQGHPVSLRKSRGTDQEETVEMLEASDRR